MVNFKAKPVKIGNSWGFIAPASYWQNGILDKEKSYDLAAEVVSDD